MQGLFGSPTAQGDDHEWLSVSDLMTGLMVVFMLIAIGYMAIPDGGESTAEAENERLSRQIAQLENDIAGLQAQLELLRIALDAHDNQLVAAQAQEEVLREQLEQKERQLRHLQATIRRVAVVWQKLEGEIYDALMKEFRNDLPHWNAEIERETLLVRFKSPEVLFEQGKADLQQRFSDILDDFFPRYARILKPYLDDLDEIRIEGHTSPEWGGICRDGGAYFCNMRLSQDRTREVLKHVLLIPGVAADRPWLEPLLTANGLSFSRLIYNPDGSENHERSRRVEFRIRTDTRAEITRILALEDGP